jgi:hypothetical protein
VTALVGELDAGSADEAEAALPFVPSQVGPGGHGTDLLNDVLSDVGDEHVAVLRIPREALRITQTQRIDLGERCGIFGERVARRNSVFTVRAVRPERIDAHDLSEARLPVL